MDRVARQRRGEAVRQLRVAQGFSSLKRIPDISHHTWGLVERGEDVTPKSLRTIAATLSIPIDWLTEQSALPDLERAAQGELLEPAEQVDSRSVTLAEASDFALIEELYRRHRRRKVSGYMDRFATPVPGTASPEHLASLGRAAYPEPRDTDSESESSVHD